MVSRALFLLVLCGGIFSFASTIPQTPKFLNRASDFGALEGAAPMRIRVWLKPSNLNLLDQYAEAVINGQTRRFLTPAEYNSKFTPTKEETEIVQNYLTSKGLRVLPNNQSQFFVLAQGSVSEIEKAFKVQIHGFKYLKRKFYTNVNDPTIEGEAAPYVMMIGGLSNQPMRSRLVRARDLDTGRPYPSIPLTDSPRSSHEINCFKGPETKTFKSGDGSTVATYTGIRFGAEITSPAPHLPPCGYGPNEIRKVYNFNELNKSGLDGSGQTIAIVDAFGSPTIREDVEAFNKKFQFPSTNLKIYQPQGVPVPPGPWNVIQQDWATETSLDVEYSHIVAPAAHIALVETVGDSDDQLLAGLQFAIEKNLGNNVSNSWGDVETLVTPALIKQYDILLKSAAVKGISVNIASGDIGDTVAQIGYEDVNFPGSPYLTSVGGTTLAMNPDATLKFETGWGENYTVIADGVSNPAGGVATQNPPLDPPKRLGFAMGSNGGPSRIYPKPHYQRNIPGNSRMQPDISYLGDSLTGVEVVQSTFDSAGNPVVNPTITIWAGTSLACPMFSGVWAIANQFAGLPLGPAAPILYSLPSSAIRDILPVSSKYNATGTITDPKGTTAISSYVLAFPQTAAPFLGTIVESNASPFCWGTIAFGTDSTLPTTLGWDPVTGLGVPNGRNFLEAVRNLVQ